ncbi:MAG: Txe/YoeB family addiction module toxin [Desulfobacterales bacterium]|nr:Txe/YoeB family addiction module toxin [Desulfobacterales bacterium]
MIIAWTDRAWDDYLYWQKHDKKILKRINLLIKDIKRHPEKGKGKPEQLRFEFAGKWSRRINREHRIVYQQIEDMIIIFQCRYHY